MWLLGELRMQVAEGVKAGDKRNDAKDEEDHPVGGGLGEVVESPDIEPAGESADDKAGPKHQLEQGQAELHGLIYTDCGTSRGGKTSQSSRMRLRWTGSMDTNSKP